MPENDHCHLLVKFLKVNFKPLEHQYSLLMAWEHLQNTKLMVSVSIERAEVVSLQYPFVEFMFLSLA